VSTPELPLKVDIRALKVSSCWVILPPREAPGADVMGKRKSLSSGVGGKLGLPLVLWASLGFQNTPRDPFAHDYLADVPRYVRIFLTALSSISVRTVFNCDFPPGIACLGFSPHRVADPAHILDFIPGLTLSQSD